MRRREQRERYDELLEERDDAVPLEHTYNATS